MSATLAGRRLETYDDRRSRIAAWPEREQVRAARNGDHEAFAALVHRHEQHAHAVALSIVRSPDDTDDVVQDAFVRAYRALGGFDEDQPFGAWLHRIVVNAALDCRRRSAAHATEALADTVPIVSRDPGEASDLRMRLSAAVADLGGRQRSVLVLHDVQGFTHGEIGVMLGIPEGTARSLLHHARHSVRRVLAHVRNDL